MTEAVTLTEAQAILARAGIQIELGHAENDGGLPTTTTEPASPPIDPLRLRPIAEVAEEVRTAGPRTFLVKRLMVGGSYGVLGAPFKGLKTFDVCDLACSVVTGSAWFGHFECPNPGPVAAYFGEGDQAQIVRRLSAIMRSRGGEVAELEGLHVALRVPRFGNKEHLARVADDLGSIRPVLCVVDPAYIAAAGAKPGSLFDMGELLAPIQEHCQDVGATLVTVWHWNQTGRGTGPLRFTGAGAAEWGRFLGSAAVERKATEDGVSVVSSRWEFTGSEIADTAFRVQRRVWAENPDDLDSPLHYEVSVSGGDVTSATSRVLQALGPESHPRRVGEIGDLVAGDGMGGPLTARTIQRTLNDLQGEGRADGVKSSGRPTRWWKT